MQELFWKYFPIGLSALLLGFLSVRLVLWLFPKIGLMDRPYKYGLKRAPIPYYGGLSIVIPFLILSLFWLKLDTQLIIFLIGAVLVTIVSFIDDLKGLSPYLRLLMQFGAGALLFYAGVKFSSLPSPFGGDFVLNAEWIKLAITVVWTVLIMNTFNWIDGLNGLSSGLSTIACLVIFFLSIRPDFHTIDQGNVATMSLILAALALVFCFHDFFPAKLLMGDSGSMFLGYALAAMSVMSGGKIATAALVLGIPILDAFWVIIRRLMLKQSPFKGDLRHFHHRLLYAGLSVRQAVILIYTLSAVFGFLSVWLGTLQKVWVMVLMLSTMAIIGFTVVLMEIEKNRKKG